MTERRNGPGPSISAAIMPVRNLFSGRDLGDDLGSAIVVGREGIARRVLERAILEQRRDAQHTELEPREVAGIGQHVDL